MPLNPLRPALGPRGLRTQNTDSPFQSESDAALSGFRVVRQDLERRVQRGDLTLKVARQLAESAANDLRRDLLQKSEGYSPTPRVFLDRLVEAQLYRDRVREGMTIEGLQRETNRLLRQTLIEQQLQARAVEFEGRTFLRPMAGGTPTPTIDSLLALHESASQAGDEAAQEWARRQLEGLRGRSYNEDDIARIDRACDRPDRVNPRLVNQYVEALQGRTAEDLEPFVRQSLQGRDANACIAAFVLARQCPEGVSPSWVRAVLEGLKEFPDAALGTLRAWEADARQVEADEARAQAEHTIALAEAEARFSRVEPPTEAEIERRSRWEARPAAQVGEPIGLTLDRRGLTPEEFQSMNQIDTEEMPSQPTARSE
ncbi:hypothetical protein BH23PLA1_BH23PLA1_09340 [soil metagenome]